MLLFLLGCFCWCICLSSYTLVLASKLNFHLLHQYQFPSSTSFFLRKHPTITSYFGLIYNLSTISFYFTIKNFALILAGRHTFPLQGISRTWNKEHFQKWVEDKVAATLASLSKRYYSTRNLSRQISNNFVSILSIRFYCNHVKDNLLLMHTRYLLFSLGFQTFQ